MPILSFTQKQIFLPPQQVQIQIHILAALHTPSKHENMIDNFMNFFVSNVSKLPLSHLRDTFNSLYPSITHTFTVDFWKKNTHSSSDLFSPIYQLWLNNNTRRLLHIKPESMTIVEIYNHKTVYLCLNKCLTNKNKCLTFIIENIYF